MKPNICQSFFFFPPLLLVPSYLLDVFCAYHNPGRLEFTRVMDKHTHKVNDDEVDEWWQVVGGGATTKKNTEEVKDI